MDPTKKNKNKKSYCDYISCNLPAI